jgi:hypothetical protein
MLCECGDRGCSSDVLAVLIQHSGEVQRDRAASEGKFEAADDKARFFSGDALRTLSDAGARLQLPASGAVVVQSDTTIRLWRGGRKGLKLNVQTGLADVIAAGDPLEIQTELGVAVLQAGGELRVRPAHRGQRYEITMGRAVLTTPDGKQLNFGAGEAIGGESPAPQPAPEPPKPLEAKPEPPPPAPAPPAPAAETPAPPLTEAAVAIAGHGDFSMPLGVSATIYDPSPPTAVHFELPAACSNGAMWSMRGRPAKPLTAAQSLALGVGVHDYQISCANGPGQWRGSLRVVRNAGTAQLPRSAPRNTIELDGRAYTILFQNLLPALDVRWPNAPSASRYTLLVELDGGRELKQNSSTPSYVLPAGSLPEGRHQLHFEVAAANAAKSRITTIDLRFDNASPTASLRSPPVSGFTPADSVQVAGIALPGAQVTVLGERFALDAQQRFTGDVELPAGTKAIAVRIQHPRTGTRYYVRRARVTR